MRLQALLLLPAFLLGGCVYNQDEAGAPDRPAYDRAASRAHTAASRPDRIASDDLEPINAATGAPDPGADRLEPEGREGYHDPYRRQQLFVQAASFRTRAQAERVRRNVANFGPAAIYTAHVGDRRRYRVRIGPFTSPERSERVRAALIRRGYSDAIVLRD